MFAYYNFVIHVPLPSRLYTQGLHQVLDIAINVYSVQLFPLRLACVAPIDIKPHGLRHTESTAHVSLLTMTSKDLEQFDHRLTLVD